MTDTQAMRHAFPRPYDEHHVERSVNWDTCPRRTFPIGELIPSQAGFDFGKIAAYLNGDLDIDRPGRVVVHDGAPLIHDGHHRWVARAVVGARDMNMFVCGGDE